MSNRIAKYGDEGWVFYKDGVELTDKFWGLIIVDELDKLNKRIAELESELNLLKHERDFWQAVEKEREG